MANLLDKAIGWFSPAVGARRAAYRRRMELLSGTRGYEGASHGRLAKHWGASPLGADAEIGRAGQRLRDRSRDMVRNNALAAKIVTSHANNFVGFGITPRAKTGDPARDKQVNDLFDEWSKVCFAGTGVDFYGGCYTLARMMVQDGEVYVRRRLRRPDDGFPVPLQLQILDAEFCDWAKSGTPATHPGNQIVQGVEFDAIGNRAGYWMFPQDPRSSLTWMTWKTSSFVPAADIAHIYEPQVNQVHGVPWLAPVMTDLDDLRDYEISENVRKKVEACVVGMVIPGEGDQNDPNIGISEAEGGAENQAAVRDIYGNPFERMEPGMFAVLNGGKDVRFNSPAISAGVEAYIRTRHRGIAAGSRLPYELLTGDFSQANFASGKLGLLEYQHFVQVVQWHYLIPQALQIIWGWFVAAGKDAGKIPRNLKVGVEWTPPEFESITRLDDARADLLEVRMGKRSMPEIIAKTGRDPMTVLAEQDAWLAAVDATKSGVILDSDPRKVANNGQFQFGLADQSGDGNAQAP